MSEKLSDHDSIVKRVRDHMKDDNYENIQAHLPEEDQPAPIEDHIPDVRGFSPLGTEQIVEVEMCDMIGSDHAVSQWLTFAAYANMNQAKFTIVVPVECLAEAKTSARLLGIKPTIIPFP